MKTAISLPDDLFEAAEKTARRLGVSRSHLYARAIAAYLEEFGAEAITEKLNEVYSEHPTELDPVLESMQSASVFEEGW
jgi:metal-responsive CopG/Arc/MetJ family transcriptional regulator